MTQTRTRQKIIPGNKSHLARAREGDLVLISGGPRDFKKCWALFKGNSRNDVDTYHVQGQKLCEKDSSIIEIYFDLRNKTKFDINLGAILRQYCGYISINYENERYDEEVRKLKEAGIWGEVQ